MWILVFYVSFFFLRSIGRRRGGEKRDTRWDDTETQCREGELEGIAKGATQSKRDKFFRLKRNKRLTGERVKARQRGIRRNEETQEEAVERRKRRKERRKTRLQRMGRMHASV
ncbi:hypothetical protein HDV63DRAFT_289212 [Trichoderma sp. SZMC 28014]